MQIKCIKLLGKWRGDIKVKIVNVKSRTIAEFIETYVSAGKVTNWK